jgi:membrane fusion protein (multidrug efflux system)
MADEDNKPTENPPQAVPAGSAPSAAAAPASAAAAPANAPLRKRRRWLRPLLLFLGPAVVLVGGAYMYMNTGRFISTDNAYVKADTVIISPQVAGPIARVAVIENQPVHAGDVLFEIDGDPYEVAVDRGEAQLEAVEAFIRGLQASYQQQLEQLKLARTNVAFAKRELDRELELAERELGSEADVDRARHEYDIAEQQIPIIEQAMAQLRAQLGGDIAGGLESHAAYRTVKSMLADARIDLEHTVVRAPFGGIASRVPMVGRYVTPGGPAMSVVADHDIWIEANYKETELTHVEPGQPVVVHVDTYPDREWRGSVESISQATGAEFSVIPAQNASGNWVKVAQRIPVRIKLDLRPGDPPLRAGMSSEVEIDTGFEREAPAFLSFLRSSSVAEAAPAVQSSTTARSN